MQRIFSFVSILGLVFTSVRAQPLGERVGPQFPFVSSNARAAGLGDAADVLLGDFSGADANPATLSFLSFSSIDYSFHRINRDVSMQHLGMTLRGATNTGFAASIDVLHYGGFDFYSNNALRERGFEIGGRLGFGVLLGDDLAAGLAVQVFSATTDSDAVWGVAADIGFSYAPGKYHRFGLVFHGLGSEYRVDNPILSPDRTDRRLPRVVSLGVSFDYPLGGTGSRFLTAFQNEKIIGERGILYKFGLEYKPAAAIALRVGGRIRHSEVEPNVGLGVFAGRIVLDYAYRYSRRDALPSHIVTLGVLWL